MLARLSPFRYIAAAVLALLIAALFLDGERAPIRSGPAGSTQQPATGQPPTGQPATDQPAAYRPPPRIGPAKLVYKVETADPVVFLTIDDGAHRDPAMADVLRNNGIRATLFLTGRYAGQDPEFFRRLRDDTGSVIENHTATHTNLRGRSEAEQAAEISPVSDQYTRWFGRRPTLFRAPYGNSDDATLQAAGEAGAKYVVNWGSVVNDGKVSFSGPHEFRPGSIVLMHFRPTFEADVKAFVAQARANGLTPALLTDYLK
jgi:peptidoglycan/xylan/chitin deacetylase (PgdA/CDA1 family)